MKKYIFLILTVITFLFASCSNFFEDSISKIEEDTASSESTKAGGESVKYVNVTGSINLEGAVPSAIRTAFPVNPNISSLTLTVRAVNTTDSSDTVTGEIVSGSNNTSYRISIPVGSTAKTYEIQIDAANSLGTVLSGKSQAFTISQASPITEQNVILRAIQTEGTGTLSLKVGISTGLGIQSAKVTYNPDPEHTSSIATEKSSNICTFAQGTINGTSITNGLACGSYLMTFEFYSGALDANHHVTGDLLYSFKQTVNIFKGLETNSWVKNGAEPYLTVSETSTQCIITATLIDEFTLTEIFVDSSLQNTDSTAAGYTSESGTFLNPCRTLSAAISKLNHADKDYKIYIKGSLSGAQIIPETLTDSSEGTYHAKSLTLIGYNGLDDSGIPQDSLDGGFTSPTSDGVTLKINSSVPVIIKNLMITGGNNAGDGGGINSKGNLTLDSGALVCRNTAVCGGGVMNSGGELTIKSGAVIANNTAYNTASDTNFTYGGGGVYNYNGKLVMSGGQIKANTTNQCGGGIYNHMNDKDKITELYIYGDAVIGGDTDADGNKANVEVDGYGGGGIYNRGGLVYLGCTAYSAAGEADTYDYYEPDASKLVEWTGKISHNTSKAWGGGYLNTFSSASSDGLSDAEKIKTTGITHMMSGQISANTAVNGGGIAVHNGSLCPIHGGIIGGSSSADGNAASQMGGGIYTMTKLNVYDATISNNSAPAGGGIYNVGILNFGGTIKNNSATSYGGGIFNEYRLQLKENAYIPAGTGGANDIYYRVADDPDDDYAPYIMISRPLNPPSDSDGIVATITPSLYESGKTILSLSTSATTTLPAEYEKFAITPENVGGGAVKEWVLRSDGILIEPSD